MVAGRTGLTPLTVTKSPASATAHAPVTVLFQALVAPSVWASGKGSPSAVVSRSLN